MKRTCKQCGAEFTLSEDEIAFYRSKNLHLPKRCEKCRRENKENRAKAGGDTARQVVRPYHEKKDSSLKWYIAAALVFVLLAVGVGVFRAGWLREGTPLDAAHEAGVEVTENPVNVDLQAAESGGEEDISADMAQDAQPEASEKPDDIVADAAQDMQSEEFGETEDTSADTAQNTDDTPADKPQQTPEDAQTAKTEPAAYTYSFRKAEYLQEHFEKHGAEFGYASADEYLAGANRVVVSPEALHKLEAEDGDDVYYLESGNEIVFVSTDGYIRTYFKPDDGKAYFDRQ